MPDYEAGQFDGTERACKICAQPTPMRGAICDQHQHGDDRDLFYDLANHEVTYYFQSRWPSYDQAEAHISKIMPFVMAAFDTYLEETS